MLRFIASFCVLALALPAYGEGYYVGLGTSLNNTNDLDHENDGIRLDWGAKVHPNLDLEWNLVDLGESSYNDPTFVAGNTDDTDEDNDRHTFKNTGFGEVNSSAGSYTGISKIHVKGLGVGLKWHGAYTSWLDIYARGSMLAWQGDTNSIEVYGEREALDSNGDPLPDGSSETPANLNPCGHLNYCRIEETGKKYWAVNYWFGAGFVFSPLDWLKLRTEASSVILKAEGFPQVQYESIGATVEVHFD